MPPKTPSFWRRWLTYAKLSALSRRLDAPFSLDDVLAGRDDYGRAKRELFDLVEKDDMCREVMDDYGADRQALETLWDQMLKARLGQ